MQLFAALAGCGLLALILVDAFSTIVVPRRSLHMFRIARAFYRFTWAPFAAIGRRIRSGPRREEFLSVYGPLSLLTLLALWAGGLILAFGLLQWAAGMQPDKMAGTLTNDIYISATTLFTLASGNPQNEASKYLTVIEGGLGICFLGMVVGYLPVLYESSSQRERRISFLDARAGSPPSAADLLAAAPSSARFLEREFVEWEKWAAQLLESQLSFPMLVYFRSHHSNQSWLTALVAIIDAASILALCAEDEDLRLQAELTFAMGRHTLADVSAVLRIPKVSPSDDRLTKQEFGRLLKTLRESRAPLAVHKISIEQLNRFRGMYETPAAMLSQYLMMALPAWISSDEQRENWRNSGSMQEVYAVSDPFRED